MRLTALFILFSLFAEAQHRPVQLHLRKKGLVKKRIMQGEPVTVRLGDGFRRSGIIARMKTDSIILHNHGPIAINDIRKYKVYREKKISQVNWKELGLITIGAGLCTLGLGLSQLETWPQAAKVSTVLGYSPLLVRKIKRMSFKKQSFRLGNKYQLRVWDLN